MGIHQLLLPADPNKILFCKVVINLMQRLKSKCKIRKEEVVI